jgi:hypothetical protein
MPSSGILRHVALVRTDVSEESIAIIIRLKRIGELITANVATTLIVVVVMMEGICSFEMPVLTRTTKRNIPEVGILH